MTKYRAVLKGDAVYCNKCGEAFPAPKEMLRDLFMGERATRLNEFCECPKCSHNDIHWIYASDKLPAFEGNSDKRKKLERKWLRQN